MLALFAYGFGSSVNLMASDSISLELPTIMAADNGQISTISNPDFEPVRLNQRIIRNVTNETTNQTNGSRNVTNQTVNYTQTRNNRQDN